MDKKLLTMIDISVQCDKRKLYVYLNIIWQMLIIDAANQYFF